ncbi:MAG: hypothetical protein ACLFSQ_09240 [Candidatus Zixiibacteriota bacterium]
MKNQKKGFSVLDILIIVLIIAVVLSLYFPLKKEKIQESYMRESRLRLVIMNKAMETYYNTAGGEIDLDPIVEEHVDDTTAVEQIEVSREAVKEATAPTDSSDTLGPRRYYTDDFEELKPFLPEAEWVEEKANLMNYEVENIEEFYPENFEPVSYPKIKDMQIFVEDSFYYVINDPNGHGTVLNGKFLWQED